MHTTRRLFLGALALLLLGLSAPAQAGEAHYLIIYAFQRIPNNPNYAHSWATFARATWPGDGPPCGPVRLEAHTISWLPANGVIRTYALLPEEGRNWDLHSTLRLGLDSQARLSLWGPYQVEPDLYRRALREIARLNSGQMRYKANDTLFPAWRVSNCIHALSDVVGRPGLYVGSPGWGEVASYAVLLTMRPWILDEQTTHYWVSSAIGLDAYPIIYRDRISPPASGTFLGPIYRLLGGERNLRATYGPPR